MGLLRGPGRAHLSTTHGGKLSSFLNITRHVLELQLHVNSVVFSHRQYDISSANERYFDYLVKNDILSYLDFLRLNQVIFAFENELSHSGVMNNSIFHSRLW